MLRLASPFRTLPLHRLQPRSSSRGPGLFVEFSTRRKTKKSSPCPFFVLGVPKTGAKYATAKKNFLKVAMNNHPDVMKQRLDEDSEDFEKEMKSAVDKFMRAKAAFEEIVEDDDGMCMLRIQAKAMDEMMNNEQFDAWFLNETGKTNSYGDFDLDPKTMREVAEATAKMGGGLDRDGGMWTLATMVSNSVKDGKNAASTLKLQAGAMKDGEEQNYEGTLRRRRNNGRRRR
jgi:DnaJ-class molecular chaperone